MPASFPTIDLLRQWRPVAESLATFESEWNSLAECADSVLSHIESICEEVAARAREAAVLQEQLLHREQELEKQRVDFARLTSRFDQQSGQLTETTEELAQLRASLADHAPPAALAADAARLALEQAERAWQRGYSEILERLSALSLTQQTGAIDSEGVQAFCRELTLVHELIGSAQEQTRVALEKQTAHFNDQMLSLAETPSKSTAADEALDKLSKSLSDLRDDLAKLQRQSNSAPGQDEVLRRLDALQQVAPPVPEESPLLTEILQKLGDASQAIDRARTESVEQAAAHEVVVAELRAELKQLRSAMEESQKPVASPFADDLTNKLQAELDAQRKLTEQACELVHRHETEQALIEAELDRVRSQAAQWQRKHEEDTAHHHEEERLWHEELQDLRHLIRQAATAIEGVSHVEASEHSPAPPKSPDAPANADPVANTLLAQFAKLQKDSARRRNRG
jgi:chromosome segregation ATPase